MIEDIESFKDGLAIGFGVMVMLILVFAFGRHGRNEDEWQRGYNARRLEELDNENEEDEDE
jgi:hypothetical protein